MMEILFLLGLIVLNGLFALSEFALATARRSRLQRLAEDGDKASLVALLSVSTDALLRLLGKRQQAAPCVTEEEIHAMLEEGSEAGVIERQEHAMVRNVFRLDERLLGSLMIPRADIVYLDVESPLDENIRLAVESEHSRFPLCRGGLDDVLGLVDTKQLLNLTVRGGVTDLATVA